MGASMRELQSPRTNQKQTHDHRTKQPTPALPSSLTPAPAATVPQASRFVAMAFRYRWHLGRMRRLRAVKIKETKTKNERQKHENINQDIGNALPLD
jgi:hypothetical protein